MNKEILYPAAAALLVGVVTWFVTTSTDFSSEHQREKIATKIMGDDEFRRILAREIMKDKKFLEVLKSDDDFRGKDGNSPLAADVANLLLEDSAFREKVANLLQKTPTFVRENSEPALKGSDGEYLAVISTHFTSDEGEALKAACALTKKREGSEIVGLSEDTSVQIWINESAKLFAVTLGGTQSEKEVDSIAYYAKGNFVVPDVIVEPSELWVQAKPSVNVSALCQK
ncbi:MAG: hypothetical protein AB8B81_22795 [Halioglobus sp.]